jgi:hypothetical protein
MLKLKQPVRRGGDASLETTVLQTFTAEQRRISGELSKTQQYCRDEYDTQFFAVVVFQSRAQVAAFLDGIGWDRERGERFVSGTALVKHLNEQCGAGIVLPVGPTWKERTPQARWVDLARGVEDYRRS